MTSLRAPIFVGRVAGHPVRFFRPPTDSVLDRPIVLPWTCFDDVCASLRLPRDVAEVLLSFGRVDAGLKLKTIATAEDGIVTVCPHHVATATLDAAIQAQQRMGPALVRAKGLVDARA